MCVYCNIARRSDLQYSEEAHNTFNIAFTKYRLKIAFVLLLHNLFYILVKLLASTQLVQSWESLFYPSTKIAQLPSLALKLEIINDLGQIMMGLTIKWKVSNKEISEWTCFYLSLWLVTLTDSNWIQIFLSTLHPMQNHPLRITLFDNIHICLKTV